MKNIVVQGYEDIDSQRRAEASYKFRWEEGMAEEVEARIQGLGGEVGVQGGRGEVQVQEGRGEVEVQEGGKEEGTLSDEAEAEGAAGETRMGNVEEERVKEEL